MHYLRLSVLSALAAGPLGSAATPFAPNWNDMRTKHIWNTVPGKWEGIGHPPVGTTIDLRIALKPHRESALIDALYEVSSPKHPRHIFFYHSSDLTYAHVSRCYVADMAHTSPRSRSLTLSRRTQTRSSSSSPGLSTTVCPPPTSQRHTVAAG